MSKKGKLGLLLMSVIVLALVLSSCFLPQPKTAPTLSVSPTTITAYSGQPFPLGVSAQGGGGISKIVATFEGSTVTKTSNPATFTFTAPTVIAENQYPLGVTVYGANGLSTSSTETVDVVPLTSVGSITYAVRLNNPYPYVYTYPAQNNNQSVMFTVNVGNGAGMVGGVSIYVDGKSIPASPTTLSSVLKATIAGTSFIVQKSFVALYSISANHVGPHTYWVNFYGNAGQLIGSSEPGYFYITYPAAQKVTLSAATPIYNTHYINGFNGSGVSFTAGATDYTSQYEGFLINDTPFATYLNIATAVTVLNKSYSISVPVSALTSRGSTTFVFKDASIGGNTVTASRSYVVVKAPPVLKVTYNGATPVNSVLYVGLNNPAINVYGYDPYWMSGVATVITSARGAQTYPLNSPTSPNYPNTSIDLSPLLSVATSATFTAQAENYANLSTILNLKVYFITVGPKIKYANVSGLSNVNGQPYSTDGTVTVAASVLMTLPNLGKVTWELSGVATPSQYVLTRSSTGLWTGSVNTAKLLPGTYKSWISAEDIAQNVATALTTPATVNVYRTPQGVFEEWLRTTPSASVNGYYGSATMGATVNSQWIYAIRKVILCDNGTAVSSTTTVGKPVYSFPITTSGKYRIVTIDNVGQMATGDYMTVNIDTATPDLSVVPACQVATKTSITIIGVATELKSGVSNLTLYYQSLGSTGMDNGAWVEIGATSTHNATVVRYAFTWNNLSTLPNGLYGLELVGVSGVGNAATLTGGFSTENATPFVVNDNSKLSVTFTPNATLVFTNKHATTVSVRINNESDVFGIMTYKLGTSSSGASGTSYFFSYSYTKYPLTEATTLNFTTQNASYVYNAWVVNYAGWAAEFCHNGEIVPTGSFNISSSKIKGQRVTTLSSLPPTDSASMTTIFVYDTMKPAIPYFQSTGGATVACETPVRFTISATDNLSGIKSVVVNGKTLFPTSPSTPTPPCPVCGSNAHILSTPATVATAYGQWHQLLGGTWSATLTSPASSGKWRVTATVTDNAGNVASTSLTIFVDNSTPTINVSLVNANGPQKISNGASEVNYTSTPASFTWLITTLSGTSATVTGKITGPSSYSKSITRDSSTVSIGTSGQYTITIVATNPINHLRSTFLATKTIVVDNTPPTVKLTLPATLNLANYSTAVATYTATDTNFEAATLTINGVSISVSKASSGTVLLNLFNLSGLSGRTLTGTLTAIDKALNASSTSATFYVDLVSPKINMTGTIYRGGSSEPYQIDVNFADPMKPTTLATSDLRFYVGNTLWYSIAAATGVSYDPSAGFLHIYDLVTPAGSVVSVAALSNHSFTVRGSTAFESLGGNPLYPTSANATFTTPYGAPKPVNP